MKQIEVDERWDEYAKSEPVESKGDVAVFDESIFAKKRDEHPAIDFDIGNTTFDSGYLPPPTTEMPQRSQCESEELDVWIADDGSMVCADGEDFIVFNGRV